MEQASAAESPAFLAAHDGAHDGNAAPTPFDIWRIIVENGWLLGGILAVGSACFESLGLILQKKAQYKLMGDNLHPEDPKPTRKQMWGSKFFWTGLILYMLYSPVNMLALKYAPETTVLPLNACIVIVNAFLCFIVLYERFRRRDITASMVCIVGAAVMNTAMSQTIPGNLEDFPVEEVLRIGNDLLSNEGFAAYMLIWLALFAMSLYIVTFVSMQSVAKPFAVPLFVGLLRALFNFMSKLCVTLLARSWHPEVRSDPLTIKVTIFTCVLFVLTVWSMSEGVQQLPCRFFVPAMFVSCQVLTATQDILFFRAWEAMTHKDVVAFVIASLVSILGVAFISTEQRVISSPDASGLNTPLLSPRTDAVRLHQSVVAIIDEYRIRRPTAPDSGPLKTIDMTVPISNFFRPFPIISATTLAILPFALWTTGRIFGTFAVLTLFSMYQGWKMGMHIVLFGYVGTKKMAHFENADFEALYQAEMKDPKLRMRTGPKWEEVMHFVVLPNYKEDTEVLRLAIKSIAASGVAKNHIILVLAMEAREEGADQKSGDLIKEFSKDFLACKATFHPVGLPGEVPGKSANTKWAIDRVVLDIIPERKLNVQNTIFTVGDADSEFHSEYFAALTYYFVHAGGLPGQTPLRYTTIWQPPIIHFKNYLTQPCCVRIASFLTSMHELANLADPNSMRVPYSTYSISAVLATGVNGWDPDWISEDWHMALKCFLGTGGRLNISPIFLPILNYAPEGDSWFKTIEARWVQAKRHALGFSELVYMMDHAGRVLRSIDCRKEKITFVWRLFFLWFKLVMIHLFMAVFFVIAPLNGVMIAYFANHQLTASLTINSWTFLANCVFQCIGLISMVGCFIVSVVMYESVKPRIDGASVASIIYRIPILHVLTSIGQCVWYIPMFFFFAGLAEWIAAVKASKTHLFDYAVALKPKLPGSA